MPKTPDEIMKELSLSGGTVMLPDGSVETRVGPEWAVPIAYPTKRKSVEKDSTMADEDDDNSTKRQRAALIEKPVENSGPVPLIPNLDANARHVITQIRVIKRTPPNDGIKGEVDSSSSLDYIAKRYGDGIYDFEALNEAGQVLRRNPNVKISYGYQQAPDMTQGANPLHRMIAGAGTGEDMSAKLLERMDKFADRSHSASEAALMATQKLSQDYASMIREDSKERNEKDRVYHKAVTEQQSHFFQAMIVNMQKMHEQSMERANQQFQQTLQMMQFSHQQTLQQNNPALLFQLFERGLKFGAEAGGGEEEESPLTSILSAATSGLSTVKEMMQLQAAPNPAMLTASAPAPVASPQKNPAKKKLPISKEQLTEVLKLKAIAESKNLDFDGLLKQAQMMVSNVPSSEEPEVDEDEEDEESDSEGLGGADMA